MGPQFNAGEGPRHAGPPRAVAPQGKTSAECIVALAKTFPTLAAQVDGLDPWDPDALDAWACGPVPSSGAYHAATFIVNLWRPRGEWRCGKFDLHQAMQCWDAEHAKAIAAWVANAWWP